MTTVQINLPDELVQQANSAGLLAPEEVEDMLRERLRIRAGQELRVLWSRLPLDEITPEIEDEIADVVRAVRADMRKREAS
jgi:hypothetical protein